jgi:hypothetical protein
MYKKLKSSKKILLIPSFVLLIGALFNIYIPNNVSAAQTVIAGSCDSSHTSTTTYSLNLTDYKITATTAGWRTVTSTYPVSTTCENKTTTYVYTSTGSPNTNYHAPAGDASTITLPSEPKINQTIKNATLTSYKLGTTDLASFTTITVNVGSTPNAPTTNNTTSDQPTTSCNVTEGWGWAICPIFNTMAKIADEGTKSIGDLLRVDPVLFNTASNAGAQSTQTAWSRFRDVANIGLILAFLVIIFSQLTSIGISNYGIKKMLPRLIISAVLINISYYVVQAGVDLSNILGKSLKDGIEGIVTVDPNLEAATWVSVLSAAGIAGVVTGTVLIWGAVGTLGPVLLAALLAVVMVFVILVARQALIILLIVVAPVAFLAYLLPNTEKMFSFWRKSLTTMLLVYPIVGLLFGASKLASNVLLNIGAGKGDVFLQIMSVGVGVVPLFALPAILKNSLNAIPAIGNIASKLQSRANAGIGKNLKSSFGKSDFNRARAAKSQIREARLNQKYAGRAAAGGFLATGGLALTKGQKAAKQQIVSRAQGAVAAEEAANLKNDISSLEYQMNQEKQTAIANGQTYDDRKVLTNIATDSTKSATQRRAAMHLAAARGYVGEVRKMQTKFETDSNDNSLTETQRSQARESLATLRLAKDANAGGLISKAPDLIKGPSAAFSDIGGGDLVQLHSSTATAHIEHLASLRQNSLDAQTVAQQPGATQEVINAAAAAAQSYKQAVTSLNEAVIDVSKNPQLQASFGGDVGRSYLDALSQHPQLQNDLGSLAGIDPASGKIR